MCPSFAAATFVCAAFAEWGDVPIVGWQHFMISGHQHHASLADHDGWEKVWEGQESALGGGWEGGGFVCVPETE